MKKYIGCLIVLLLILLPKTNSKYVLSEQLNLNIETPSFNVIEMTNGPLLIKDYKNDYIEVTIKNPEDQEVKGEIVIDGVKLQDIKVAAKGELTYKIYLTKELNEKILECDIYPVRLNYLSPYKVSKDITTIKKDASTIHNIVKCMNLGTDKEHKIDYTNLNSADNGEGVYLFDETKDDTHPVYFFRGTHNLNNNLIYANFCWKIVRTTETGGVRIFYNGVPEKGKCNIKKASAAQIGMSKFNTYDTSITDFSNRKYAGYMYGDNDNPYLNYNSSTVKAYIDNWYQKNILANDYEEYLDKRSIYCGDRSPTKGNHFAGYARINEGKPSLSCPLNDSYSVESGNKKLIYPISLLSIDEANLAGALLTTNNQNFYLNSDYWYWLLSPSLATGAGRVSILGISSAGASGDTLSANSIGVRPALTLKGELPVFEGNGSKDKPFVIQSLSKKIISESLGNDKELGIDYSNVNSETNGEGVYLFDETKNDTHPVYFFRGTHQLKNNLLYANFCWKIVRTTETGGVRVIYNGTPVNGKCTNTTGSNTQIGASAFNTSYNKKQYVGYMYGDDTNPYENTNDSDIKKYIDDWYKINILNKNFTKLLDNKSIYCGDRTEGTDRGTYIQYRGRDMAEKSEPSLRCQNNDSYSVEAGNRKLKYPIALLSPDEVMLAGGSNWSGSSNANYYLYNNHFYYLLTPSVWHRSGVVYMLYTSREGRIYQSQANIAYGVRPVLTISKLVLLKSGNGLPNNPYII